MKQITLSIIAVIIYLTAPAQGLYIRGGIGNAIPAAGQTLDMNGNPFNGTITYTYSGTTKENYDVKKASFSAGFQSQLGIGYMFSQHVGMEINIAFIITPTAYTAHEDSTQNPVGSDIYNATITRKSSLPVLITPSLVYNTGGKHFQGYARGGITLPMNTKITEEQNYSGGFPYSSDEYIRLETKSKFGIGFSGAMGLQYVASKNIRIWVEAGILSMSLYGSQASVTQHTLDGTNSTREPVAGTVIKYGGNGNYSLTSQPVYSIPFSNAGMSIGIAIQLSNTKENNSPASDMRKKS